MATSTNPRDERHRNRNLRREEEERREQLRLEALQEQRRLEEERRTDMERADVVRKRLQKSVLKDQGVLLSDTEDRVYEGEPNEPQSPPLPAESHFVYEEEEYNLTLSPSASEESDTGDIVSQSGKSEQLNARTTYLEEEKVKLEERLQQVHLREQETLRRGRELEERRIAFERKMA